MDPVVEAFFKSSISAQVGDGQKIKFWSDPWVNGEPLSLVVPNLLELVPPRHRKNRTMAQAVHGQQWTRDVTGTFSDPAVQEMELLWNHVQAIEPQEDREDTFRWKWSADGSYTTRSAYRALHQGASPLHKARHGRL